MTKTMTMTLLALLVSMAACASNDEPELIALENSHGKADGRSAVGVTLTSDAPVVAFFFECEDQPTCDITFGLEQVVEPPDAPRFIEQLWRSSDPYAANARVSGGGIPVLSTRLIRPDRAIHEGVLHGFWDPNLPGFVPSEFARVVYEDQPAGSYVMQIRLEALEHAGFRVFGEWR